MGNEKEALKAGIEQGTYKWVGTRPIRPDGADKVTGRAAFGADLDLPGMVTGAVLRSPHAHARIRSIDTSAARALPGVLAVVTGGATGPSTMTRSRSIRWVTARSRVASSTKSRPVLARRSCTSRAT